MRETDPYQRDSNQSIRETSRSDTIPTKHYALYPTPRMSTLNPAEPKDTEPRDARLSHAERLRTQQHKKRDQSRRDLNARPSPRLYATPTPTPTPQATCVSTISRLICTHVALGRLFTFCLGVFGCLFYEGKFPKI